MLARARPVVLVAQLFYAISHAANSTGVGAYIAQGVGQSSSSIDAACAAYQTALPNNTLGWYTTGPNLTFPGAIATWSCLPENVPCNLICGNDRPDCISSGSSVAATCSPQWSAYSCSYSSYVSAHITGSYTTAYGDIFTSTVIEYPTTVTADTHFTFQKWGGDTTIITPVYVFGEPTPVTTITSTNSDYATHTVASSVDFYWSSTTIVEKTYGTTYTTAYLNMYEIPLTQLYPVPTPACTITEVYSETCDSGGTAAGQYCNIYGGTVEVYYWPGVTPGPDGKFANTTQPVNPSTTEVSGVTMTSPSVYVSFESVYAADSCRQIGAMHTGSVLAFDPASISTVYGEGFLSDAIPNGASMYNFGDLGPTINAAAYERQVQCIVETGCPTIYTAYAPTISVPSELRSLDPAWASCYPDFRGFYDPPKALQQQQTIAGPSLYVSATPSPTVSSPLAVNTGGSITTSLPPSLIDETYTTSSLLEVVIASETIKTGGQTVIGGTTYSLASSDSNTVVDGVTTTLQSAQIGDPTLTSTSSDLTGDQTVPGSVIGSKILTDGTATSVGSGQKLVDGATYASISFDSTVVVNGATSTLQSEQTGDPDVLTLESSTLTEDQTVSGFVIGSNTLTEGATLTVGSGSAAQTLHMTTASDGETVVVFGTTGTQLVLDASETLPSSQPSSYTEKGVVSGFVIGSETLTEGAVITVGSGTAAQTLRMTTESNGDTVVIFGTTSTQLILDLSETSPSRQPSSASTSPSDLAASGSAGSGLSINTNAAGNDRGLVSTMLVLIVLAACSLLVM
ncbi:hypothetical protein LTR08_002038 [Meristemomyces frigidus]|nr:hypothetical protein LTR08_002038 [Meristemomyces frigidus]